MNPYYLFGRNIVFLPRLVGAFLIVIAIVMFVAASGRMFDVWDALKNYPECIEKKDLPMDSFLQVQYCKQSLAEVTGLRLRVDQAKPTTRQFIITLLPPVAELFFWAAALVVGLMFYNRRPVLPVAVRPVKEKKGKR